tara:strand:- start:170 stop:277 length:108 start_codon:yes stop_codon:yes gene_type:complete
METFLKIDEFIFNDYLKKQQYNIKSTNCRKMNEQD